MINFEEISINESDFYIKQNSIVKIIPYFTLEKLNFLQVTEDTCLSFTYAPTKINQRPCQLKNLDWIHRLAEVFVESDERGPFQQAGSIILLFFSR